MRCSIILLLVYLTTAIAQTKDSDKWWPSPWGADDQRGAMNYLDATSVLKATRLIKEGQIFQLGRIYEADMPKFAKRHFSLTIPGLPTGGPMGKNALVYNDEVVSGEIGQVGTQFDGLGHIGTRIGNEDVFYNGFKLSEFGDSYGLKKLGVENVGVFFTRGLLLDVAAYKKVERLQPGYVITVADIEGTLAMANTTIEKGDVVLFHTGHGKLWASNRELYNAEVPGAGITAIKWLVAKNIILVGADNWSFEAVPAEDEDRPFEGHQWLLNRHGVHILENLDLTALARDKVYEFAFIFAPLRLKGATGSPGNPVAVR